MGNEKFYIAKMTDNTYYLRDGVFTTDRRVALANALNGYQALNVRDTYGCSIYSITFNITFDYELDELRRELNEEKEGETDE